eukprot:7908054-Pyramimonas_sp.AAC.1
MCSGPNLVAAERVEEVDGEQLELVVVLLKNAKEHVHAVQLTHRGRQRGPLRQLEQRHQQHRQQLHGMRAQQ